ncbi:MAG TPA: O-antigen ligase family protein [Terriglobia bacterium]|nr:O-antigen ligase family protein [Terriglobia bacterium]
MNKLLEIILSLVIIGSTLAFGGVQPFTYSLMELALFFGVLLLLLKQTREGRISIPLPVWPLLFAAWIGLQIVPLPAGLIRLLSPARLANAAIPGAPAMAWATLSIYPHATLVAGIKFLAYLSGFVLAAYLFDSRKRRSILLQTLVFLGVFEAGYGIVQYLTGWQKIFTYTKVYYTGEASGTYINHNHFAGLLELTLPLIVAAAFYAFQIWSDSRRHWVARDASAEATSPGFQLLFYMALSAVMIVAVIFSRSRGGILGAVFSIVFIGLLAQFKVRRKAWMLGLVAFLAVAVGYGMWIGLGPVLERFEQIGNPNYLQLEGRVAIWKDALSMIRDYPWTGVGLGAFEIAFRHYQTSLVTFFVDHAHNDYIELLSETGAVGLALLFVPVAGLLVRMMVSFVRDSRRYRPSITLGCLGGALALLLHSATDFNLQVPSNALILAVVLGIGYKTACIERRDEKAPEKRRAAEPMRASASPRSMAH